MLADCKLLHFVKEYEQINGELAISPNMHLHFLPATFFSVKFRVVKEILCGGVLKHQQNVYNIF